MKTKSLIALLCVMAMFVCLFAGCSSEPTPTDATPTPESTPAPESTPVPETPTPTPTEPTPDVKPEFTYNYDVIDEEAKTAILRTIILPAGVRKSDVTELVLPSEVDGYTVEGIGWDVFGKIHSGGLSDDNWLEKVTFPGTVEFFENSVFREAHGCKEIIFENEANIKYLDNAAFRETVWEEQRAAETGFSVVNGIITGIYDSGDVVIPDGITAISGRPFQTTGYAAYVTSVTIPNSVTYIKELFYDVDENAIVKCQAGSYAEQWCIENSVKYEIITVD